MQTEPLKAVSLAGYNISLPQIIGVPLMEIFYNIGIDLIEIRPEYPYIHALTGMLQEGGTFDSLSDANLKVAQVFRFYNESIAFYEMPAVTDPDGDGEQAKAIEAVIEKMLSLQPAETSRSILDGAVGEAIETVAREYGFYDSLDTCETYGELMDFACEKAFAGLEELCMAFETLLSCEAGLAKENIDQKELYRIAMLLFIVLVSLNNVRKLRLQVEADRPVPRTGRNDPCPCGSGKKYKKCCMRKNGE